MGFFVGVVLRPSYGLKAIYDREPFSSSVMFVFEVGTRVRNTVVEYAVEHCGYLFSVVEFC